MRLHDLARKIYRRIRPLEKEKTTLPEAELFYVRALSHYFTAHPNGLDLLNIEPVKTDNGSAKFELTSSNRLVITPNRGRNPVINVTTWDTGTTNIHFVERGPALPKNPLPLEERHLKALQEINPVVAKYLEDHAVAGWFQEKKELETRYPHTNPDVLGPRF